mmetsp:Transcript_34444/g.111074  ORF Transcript_34444/g.111074 Transcript_34444/m.111074 type:complete len:413 (+) Transcript_34444:129-1367(+)
MRVGFGVEQRLHRLPLAVHQCAVQRRHPLAHAERVPPLLVSDAHRRRVLCQQVPHRRHVARHCCAQEQRHTCLRRPPRLLIVRPPAQRAPQPRDRKLPRHALGRRRCGPTARELARGSSTSLDHQRRPRLGRRRRQPAHEPRLERREPPRRVQLAALVQVVDLRIEHHCHHATHRQLVARYQPFAKVVAAGAAREAPLAREQRQRVRREHALRGVLGSAHLDDGHRFLREHGGDILHSAPAARAPRLGVAHGGLPARVALVLVKARRREHQDQRAVLNVGGNRVDRVHPVAALPDLAVDVLRHRDVVQPEVGVRQRRRQLGHCHAVRVAVHHLRDVVCLNVAAEARDEPAQQLLQRAQMRTLRVGRRPPEPLVRNEEDAAGVSVGACGEEAAPLERLVRKQLVEPQECDHRD